ncbi:MAG TPA: DUF6020 family protein, partial [Micromonosporaceae bacterium]
TQHSVLYNGLLWLSLQLTGELALLTLAQTVVMAAGLGYAVTGLRRLGGSGRWLAVAAVGATCLPVVGTFTVYVSKDVGFVLCLVWALGTVARILAERPRPAPRRFVVLFAEFALMALLRQNAFVVIVLATVLLVVLLTGWRVRLRLAAAGLAAIAVSVLANAAVYPALGVRPAGSELVLGPAYADIAVAYANRPTGFTAAERRLMSTVAPLDYWSTSANCYNADATVTYAAKEFNFAAARAHQAQLFDLWLRLVKRMPEEIIQARLCRGSIGWNPFPGPAQGPGRTVKIPIAGVRTAFNFPADRLRSSPYAGAIRSAPLNATAHKLAVFARHASDPRSFQWFAWRGATWAYLAYLAVIVLAVRRRDRGLLALAALVAASQLNVVLNNPGQLVRYMVGPLILGIVLLPMAFAGDGRVSASERTGAGPETSPATGE